MPPKGQAKKSDPKLVRTHLGAQRHKGCRITQPMAYLEDHPCIQLGHYLVIAFAVVDVELSALPVAAGHDAPPLPLGVPTAARLGAPRPLSPLGPLRRQRARNLRVALLRLIRGCRAAGVGRVIAVNGARPVASSGSAAARTEIGNYRYSDTLGNGNNLSL